MGQAVLWVGDVDESIQTAFAAHALRLDVSVCAQEAHLAVQRAEPAFVIFARWSRRCARLIARWRQAGRDMPVLVGVQPEVAECRAALDAGATDYLLRPFSADAAITRMRSHTVHRPAARRLVLGTRTIDLAQRMVFGPTGAAPLTDLEARLLAFLSTELDTPVRTETILRQVWGYTNALQTRAVANTVMRLRRKIEEDPTRPRHLLTVRGLGYRLVAPLADPIGVPERPAPIGRRHIVESACAALMTQNVLLYGPPGVGKSHLASAVAEAGAAEVIRVDLTTATTPEDVMRALAKSMPTPRPSGFGLPDAGPWIAAQARVLVLDGADRALDPLLDALEGWPHEVRVLITAQRCAAPPRMTPMRVEPLAAADALELLKEEGRRAGADLDYATPAAHALVRALDGLPAAIVHAAHRLPVLSFGQVAARCGQLAERDALGISLRGAWDALDEPARAVLRAAAQLPDAFGYDAIEAATDAMVGQMWLPDVLADLMRRSLIEQDAAAPLSTRFRLLACVRLWVQGNAPTSPQPEPGDDRSTAKRRAKTTIGRHRSVQRRGAGMTRRAPVEQRTKAPSLSAWDAAVPRRTAGLRAAHALGAALAHDARSR